MWQALHIISLMALQPDTGKGDGGGSHWQAGNEPQPPKTQQGRAAFQRGHGLRSGSYIHSQAPVVLGFSGLQPT